MKWRYGQVKASNAVSSFGRRVPRFDFEAILGEIEEFSRLLEECEIAAPRANVVRFPSSEEKKKKMESFRAVGRPLV